MDVQYYTQRGDLVISFEPFEADNLSLLLQLVWEDEWQRGTLVPNLKIDFFRKLATSKKKFRVKFSYEYLEFVIVFLEETCMEWAKNGVDTSELEQFLHEIYECCPLGETIQ